MEKNDANANAFAEEMENFEVEVLNNIADIGAKYNVDIVNLMKMFCGRLVVIVDQIDKTIENQTKEGNNT